MSTPIKYTVAMTLRLDQPMADDVEDIADSFNLSKASFVRRSIRRAIQYARLHELPLIDRRVRRVLTP